MTPDTSERAWQATPDIVVLAIERQAKYFYSSGRLSRGRTLLKRLVKMRPAAADYWMILGVIYRRQDRLVQSLRCLKKAVDIDENHRYALVNLAEVLVLSGRLEEGVNLLRAAIETGCREGKPATQQDVVTRRAGAQLALLAEIAESLGN